MNKEQSEKYIEIVKNGNMDDMYDFGVEQGKEEAIKLLEEITKWPNPQGGAGEGLGALAGAGMYIQYDHDTEKHTKQIEEVINKLKND